MVRLSVEGAKEDAAGQLDPVVRMAERIGRESKTKRAPKMTSKRDDQKKDKG